MKRNSSFYKEKLDNLQVDGGIMRRRKTSVFVNNHKKRDIIGRSKIKE